MTVIYHEHDADRSCIAGSRIAVVGYGDAGAAWARNLRDAGREVVVCTRPGPSAERAAIDGYTPRPLTSAADADIVCLLVPDGVVATLPFDPPGWALTVVASGGPLAAGRFDPNGDVGMIVPKAAPDEVRRRYLSGDGVVSAIGVHHDRTGGARARLLAVARDLGALGQGAIEMSAAQEALLSLAVERALRPELEAICTQFLQSVLEHGVPLEAVISELVVGGELADIGRLLRSSAGAGATAGSGGGGVAGDECANRRIGEALRRIVDDLAAGRLAGDDDGSAAPDPRLEALLSPHNLSAEALVIDLRARLDPAGGGPVAGR